MRQRTGNRRPVGNVGKSERENVNKRQITASILTFIAAIGVIGGTIGYATYYRSDRYRRSVERDLTAFFGLPLTVGHIVPHSFTARQLYKVELWLPDQRARVALCPRVVWDSAGADQIPGAVLDIFDASIAIGSPEWEQGDYMRVLRASLQHNFQELNIGQIRFHQGRFDWPREELHMTAARVDGRVTFNPDGSGRAELVTHSFNNVAVPDAIRITARLDPTSEDFLPDVRLAVPRLPLPALRLDEVLGSRITQGSFEGEIRLRSQAGRNAIDLAGKVWNVDLAEFTRKIESGPVAGTVNLTIEELHVEDRQLERLSFHGEANALEIDALLRRLGLPEMGGTANVTVYRGRMRDGSVDRLTLGGDWTGGSMDRLTELIWGVTGIDGTLHARVNALVITGGEVVSGDVTLSVQPPEGRPGTVHRNLLTRVLKEYTRLPLPERLLPERIEYVHMGARLLIAGDQVRILSPDGPSGTAIVTLRLFNRDVPVLEGFDQTVALTPLIDKTRSKVDELNQRIRAHPSLREDREDAR